LTYRAMGIAATAPRKVVRLAQVRAGLRAAIRLPTRVATPFALSLAPLANATSRTAAMSRTTMATLLNLTRRTGPILGPAGAEHDHHG
jgi:hypothetical protein